MSFTNYLEDENDKPYFTKNSLAYYYDKMEGFAKAVEGSAKALNLTKEEVEKRLTLYIEQNKNELDQRLAQWDGKLETFDSSVETLLSEWVNDGTLTHVIDSTLIDQRIEPVTAQLAANAKFSRYRQRQTNMLAKFYNKLARKELIKVVAQGDSLTYGHDTTSTDSRPASTSSIDDGSTHTTTRASISYPEKLQANLREVYSMDHVVINKGRSGDYAGLSYSRWTKNENSDLALLMLGTNDASDQSYIPTATRRNIEVYVTDMRKIIERFLDWNTPVILLTPPRRKEQEHIGMTGNYVEPFRQSLFSLGKEYGCPVVDMEEFCNGLDNTHYSDSTHFNGKGYSYLADRLTSKFVGFFNTPKIMHGGVIGNRPTRDNMVVNDVTFSVNTASTSAEEGSIKGESILASIVDGSLYLSFYAESDNLVLLPVQGFASGASAKYTLDFGSEQGSVPLLPAIERSYTNRIYPPSVITTTLSTNTNRLYNYEVNTDTVNEYIHIANKGFHTIKIENGAKVGSFFFQGFVVKSYGDFAKENKKDNAFTLAIQAATTGSPTYEKRVSQITRLGNLVNHFVTFKGTMSSDMAGSVSIPLKEKLENISGFTVSIPIQAAGIFTDNTVVTGLILANSSTLYLQKTLNGATTNLQGTDIAGKTIELTFGAIYPIAV